MGVRAQEKPLEAVRLLGLLVSWRLGKCSVDDLSKQARYSSCAAVRYVAQAFAHHVKGTQ